MFTDNKYTRWYQAIVSQAQTLIRIKGGSIYYEDHHIIPKSLGGIDSSTNLVRLTAREHFICHLLLVKMVKSKAYQAKMTYAFFRFKDKNPNSHLYERFKIAYSKTTTGESNPAYGKRWRYYQDTKEIVYLTDDEALDRGNLVVGLPEQRGGHRDTLWINNGTMESMISNKTELPTGWIVGRLIVPSQEKLIAMAANRHTIIKDEEHRQKLKGRKRIINPQTGETKSVKDDILIEYLANGFVINNQVITSLSKRCRVNGIVYESLASAALANKVSAQTTTYRLRSTNDRWQAWQSL